MKKYLSVFKISFEQEFAYRLNFIMWRFRNVMQVFVAFFLWDTIFASPGRVVFGYDRAMILTYVFGIMVMRAFVFSSRAIDVAGEISNGDVTNHLLKPVSYFKYWFTRDVSSKALNLLFAFFETILLFLILKPQFYLQTNPLYFSGFLVLLILAIFLFFFLMFMVNMSTFWMPENGWAAQFLFMGIITEFLAGGIFPIDILPASIQKVLYLLPFPYLLFFPLQVYLGKVQGMEVLRAISISVVWVFALAMIVNFLWKRGLRKYAGEGR